MDLCTCVSEERGTGQGAGSQALSLLSDTRRCIILADLRCPMFGFKGACPGEMPFSFKRKRKEKKQVQEKAKVVATQLSIVF